MVDDEDDVRQSVSDILRTSGFDVDEAADGAVALRLLREHTYRMVLLDLRMPVLDGVALMESAETVPPVVIHSAVAPDDRQRSRLGARVVQYLRKPVAPDDLVAVVSRVVTGGAGSSS
ncbi:MAG: response regulator [Acidimicrobiales bacterium]